MSSELAKRLKDRIEQEEIAYRKPIVEKYFPLLNHVRKVNDRWDALEIDAIVDSYSEQSYHHSADICLVTTDDKTLKLPFTFKEIPTVDMIASASSSLFTFFEGLSKNNVTLQEFVSATRSSSVFYATSHGSELSGYHESTTTVFDITLNGDVIQVRRDRFGKGETINIDADDISTKHQLENAIAQKFLELEKQQAMSKDVMQSLQQIFDILKIDQAVPEYGRPVEYHIVLKDGAAPESRYFERINPSLLAWINNEPSLIKIVNESPDTPTNKIWLITITESGRIAILSKKGLVTENAESVLPELGKQNKQLSTHIEAARSNPFIINNRYYAPNFGH
jgi:hypothetical protein